MLVVESTRKVMRGRLNVCVDCLESVIIPRMYIGEESKNRLTREHQMALHTSSKQELWLGCNHTVQTYASCISSVQCSEPIASAEHYCTCCSLSCCVADSWQCCGLNCLRVHKITQLKLLAMTLHNPRTAAFVWASQNQGSKHVADTFKADASAVSFFEVF